MKTKKYQKKFMPRKRAWKLTLTLMRIFCRTFICVLTASTNKLTVLLSCIISILSSEIRWMLNEKIIISQCYYRKITQRQPGSTLLSCDWGEIMTRQLYIAGNERQAHRHTSTQIVLIKKTTLLLNHRARKIVVIITCHLP
jgi:hypothetical protein